MYFDWDVRKAASNLKKHGVSFELAVSVFDDPFHLSVPDAGTAHEERWITIGLAADRRSLVVVHSYRVREGGEHIRIISARPATKRERYQYEARV